MNDPTPDDRTTDLEARLAWTERQLSELDGVVRELYDEVLRLRREVEGLRQDGQSGGLTEGVPGHEPPPHY
jgi:uncharacterized coiled-coil protein SlyX